MDTSTHVPQAPFAPGDRVYVRDYDVSYLGTVVQYWRNGAFIIREDDHGTTCAHHHSKLTPA